MNIAQLDTYELRQESCLRSFLGVLLGCFRNYVTQILCSSCFIVFSSVPDQCHFGPDTDPALFVSDLRDANQNFLLINTF
jgi:hypothetical protein